MRVRSAWSVAAGESEASVAARLLCLLRNLDDYVEIELCKHQFETLDESSLLESATLDSIEIGATIFSQWRLSSSLIRLLSREFRAFRVTLIIV